MDLLVRNVRPWGGPLVDLPVTDGRIADAGEPSEQTIVVEGGGRLALPTVANAHVHPDKTLWRQPWLSRPDMVELDDFISYDVGVRSELTSSSASRSLALMQDAVAAGTRAMRAHVDVAPVYGVDNVLGVRSSAAQLADALDVQVVAFPQLGVQRTPGTAAVLAESIDAGADLVGGIDPWSLDGDARGQLDLIFGLAADKDVDLDIHLHDRGTPGVEMVQTIAGRALSHGLVGRVTISHAFGLGDGDPDKVTAAIDALVAADVALTTCAYSDPPLLPVDQLMRAGVRVGLGTDGIRDPWSGFGSPDMLERVWLLAFGMGASSDAQLELPFRLAASAASDLLGLSPAGLLPGDAADFMLVRGECLAQVVVDRPVRDLVFKAGRLVASGGQYLESP
jgi:cytosine deaminase